MAAARIAAVFLTAILPLTSAQQPSESQLTVQVVDRTGAFVSGARIAINPLPASSRSFLAANSQGLATIGLPSGRYTLSIAASGFADWTRQVEVQSGADRTITATLEVVSGGDPVIVDSYAPDIPCGTPEPVFIPLQPVSNLAPLPSHGSQKR
jgi:hypothetical protein